MATTKQPILPVLWGAKMLGHQIEDREGPHLGEGLVRVLVFIALAKSSTRPCHLEGHRAVRYTPPVTVIHSRAVITCSTPSCLLGLCFRAGFMRLQTGSALSDLGLDHCHSPFHFTLLSQVQGYNYRSVKSYRVLAVPWLLSFFLLRVPHRCKVTYSLNFFPLQLQLPILFVFKAHISPRMKTKVKGHMKGNLSA